MEMTIEEYGKILDQGVEMANKVRHLNGIIEVNEETISELRRLRDLWYDRSEELRMAVDRCYALLKRCYPIVDPRSKLGIEIKKTIGEEKNK